MRPFLFHFALTYTATILLVSGVGHAFRLQRFCHLIREQGVVPAALAGVLALGVSCCELIAGGVSLLALQESVSTGVRIAVLAATTIMAAAFWLYLRRLLHTAPMGTSCGCSPLSAPLTRASLAPSAGLAGASVIGLAALGGASTGSYGLLAALPYLWGVTWACLTALYPASVFHLTGRAA